MSLMMRTIRLIIEIVVPRVENISQLVLITALYAKVALLGAIITTSFSTAALEDLITKYFCWVALVA
jgi:hypothetical protein